MNIKIVGYGMADGGTLTQAATLAIASAGVIIGAPRLLEALSDREHAECIAAILPEDITRELERCECDNAVILMSGDTGFYSGTKRLAGLLHKHNVEIIPGVSSVSFLASKLCRPWQDWKLASVHGRSCDVVGTVRDNAETFFLTGGEITVSGLLRRLSGAGFGDLIATVGEQLGTTSEKITQGAVSELLDGMYGDLSVVLVDNPTPRNDVSRSLPDTAFVRGTVPMTKREVRSVILSQLALKRSGILYDIGAGTGSVSIEAALMLCDGRVFAFERGDEGVALIRQNAFLHKANNITVVQGEAPESMSIAPRPDAAFIGGSGGKLSEILDCLQEKNLACRVVIAAVTLETLSAASAELAKRKVTNVEISQISVSRTRLAGGYHLFDAQNPVFVISFAFCGEAD